VSRTPLVGSRYGGAALVGVLLLGLLVGIALVLAPGPYLLVAVGGVAFVVVTMARPAWGLAFAVFLGPLFASVSVSAGTGLPDITFARVAVVCVIVGYLFRSRSGERGNLAIEAMMTLYSAILLATTFVRYPPLHFIKVSLYFSDCYVIPFIYFYLAKQLLCRKERFALVFWCALLTGLCVAAIGLYEFVARTDLMAGAQTLVGGSDAVDAAGFMRSNGPFAQTSTYSVVLGMLFFIGFYRLCLRFTAPRRRWLVIVFMACTTAFQLAALSLALMRMTILAVLVGIGSRVLFFRRALRLYVTAVVVFVLIAALGWGWVRTTTIYRNRLADMETGYVRLATWKVALRLVPRYALVGAGFNAYGLAQETLRERVDYRGHEPRPTAHNSFLNLIIESGVAGLSVYCALLFMLWRRVIRYARLHPSNEEREFAAMVSGVFCMYVVPSLTLGSFTNPDLNGLFFTCMGMLAGRLQRSEEGDAQP